MAGPVGVRVPADADGRSTLLPAFDPGGGGPVQIRYRIGPRAQVVWLSLFDARGRLIWSSAPGLRAPGEHALPWNRLDQFGTPAVRGAYFLHLKAGKANSTRKLVLRSR